METNGMANVILKALVYLFCTCLLAGLVWLVGEFWFGVWNKVVADLLTLPHFDMVHIHRVILFVVCLRSVVDSVYKKGIAK